MDAYTREELESLLPGAKPSRGQYCPKCKVHIPEFVDIPPDMAAKLRRMHAGIAMPMIRDLTGCPLDWAKAWFGHRNGPHREFGETDAPPCPHCGKQLRTKLAKQCVECGADWHNT
jgi:hypothetical protein